MSRPQKKGLDYFPLDTTLDESVEMIEAEFGMKGFGLWIKILQKIYGDKGYYIEWNKDQSLLFAKRANLKGSLVDDIVSRLIKRGLFNESLFNSSGIFTSKAIQKRYLDACTRRKSVEIISEFVLVDINDYSNVVNVDINEYSAGVNVDINSQRKGKESKHRDTPRERPREAEFSDPYRLNVPVPEQIRSDPDWISVIEKWLSHLKEKNCFPTSYQQEAIVQEQASIGKQRSIASILHSIKNGWKSIHEPKPDKNGDYKQSYRRGYKPTQGDRQIEQLKTF